MPYALPQLDILIAALLALAVCLLVVAFAKAFFGVAGNLLGKLPVVGGWIDAGAHKIEQRITNTFGGFAVKLEAVVGASWHSMARLVDRLGHELAAHAGLLAAIAQFIPAAGIFGKLYLMIQEARALSARLAHALVGIGHDVAGRLHSVERGIGADVLPRIRSLDRRLDRVISKDIPGLRTAERALAGDLAKLRRYVNSHPWTAATSAFAGAIALALAKLGLDWLRCPTARSVFNKRGCNMWSGLDNLLGLFGEVFLLANICRIIPWLEEGFSLVAAPLISTLTTVGAGLCDPAASAPELLPDVSLYVPASAGSTLYLP